MHIVIILAIALVVLLLVRRRQVARAIYKQTDREVWAQASELRPPHYPRRARPFGKSRGLK